MILAVASAVSNVTARQTRQRGLFVLSIAKITITVTSESFVAPTAFIAGNKRRRIGMTIDKDTLEWAAKWIEDSLKGETDKRVVEFGKNMAMTLRAATPTIEASRCACPLSSRIRLVHGRLATVTATVLYMES